ARIAADVGLDRLMFEAADPAVFGWYVKNYGPDVNLFVDHSQIVQLECLRSGIWGTKSMWGRVVAYPLVPTGKVRTRRSVRASRGNARAAPTAPGPCAR